MGNGTKGKPRAERNEDPAKYGRTRRNATRARKGTQRDQPPKFIVRLDLFMTSQWLLAIVILMNTGGLQIHKIQRIGKKRPTRGAILKTSPLRTLHIPWPAQ